MLAMDVNDDAYFLDKRIVIKSIASKQAPTFFLPVRSSYSAEQEQDQQHDQHDADDARWAITPASGVREDRQATDQ